MTLGITYYRGQVRQNAKMEHFTAKKMDVSVKKKLEFLVLG
jgi:hypothetical protein